MEEEEEEGEGVRDGASMWWWLKVEWEEELGVEVMEGREGGGGGR